MLKVYQLRRKQNSFDVTFKYRGVSVRCEFTDGNTYNGKPARCYVRDPFKQRAIEASTMFKDNEIVLERTIKEPGDDRPKISKRVIPPLSTVDTDPPLDSPTDKNEVTTETGSDSESKTGEGITETGGDGESKTFANLGEAILFIYEQWQITVQTENEARKVLKEHGINPTIKRG